MFLWAWFCIIACCGFWIAVTLVLGKEFYWQPDGWGFQQRKLTTKAEDCEEVKTSEKPSGDADSAKAEDDDGAEWHAESTTDFFCSSAADDKTGEEIDESAPKDVATSSAVEAADVSEEQAPLLSANAPNHSMPETVAAEAPPGEDTLAAEDHSESDEESEVADAAAAETELSPAEVEERLKRALAKKESGNECFKAGALEEACALYNEALNLCPAVKGQTASIIFTNLAHTLNRRELYAEGLEAAEAAIELDQNNGKAFLRKYDAASALDKIHEAYNALKTALELRPELRREYGSQLATLKHRSESKLEEEKAEMLGKLKEFGSWALGKVGMSIDDFKMVQDPATGSYNIQYNPSTRTEGAEAPSQTSL